MVKVSRRHAALRRRSPSAAEEARRMLAELGTALEVAIVVQEVEGVGPVRVHALVLHGSDAVVVEVEGPTEAEAIAALGRRAIEIRGADASWIRRYGLGA